MAGKTSGDSTLGVSAIIFRGIQDSFTTQAEYQNPPESSPKASLARERAAPSGRNPIPSRALNRFGGVINALCAVL